MTNTTTKKVTKAEMFAKLREVVKDNAELVAFIDHEVELLSNRKKSSKETATQKLNRELKAKIVEILTASEKAMTVTEIGVAEGSGYTTPKITALVTQLVDDKKVKREVVKGRAYFSV